MLITLREGTILDKDSLGFTYDITNGAYVPVSLDIGGGKELVFEHRGEGLYQFKTPDGSLYSISKDQGAPVVRDETGAVVADPMSRLGFDPTIVLEKRNEPASISQNNIGDISARISADLAPTYTFTKGELVNKFGGGQPVSVRDEYLPDGSVGKTLSDSQGRVLHFNPEGALTLATDAGGHPIAVDKNEVIPDTKIKMGDKFAGEQFDHAKASVESFRENEAAYKQIVDDTLKVHTPPPILDEKGKPKLDENGKPIELWSTASHDFLKELLEENPLENTAKSAKEADVVDRGLYTMIGEGLARKGTTLAQSYNLFAKGDYLGADKKAQQYFSEEYPEKEVKPKKPVKEEKPK